LRPAGAVRAASPWGRRLLWAGLCAGLAAAQAGVVPLDSGSGTEAPAPWRAAGLPQQKDAATRFDMVELEGRRVLRLQADRSYGNLLHALAPGESGRWLSWRWRVDQPNPRANLRKKSGDDAAAKICVLFDLPLSTLPFFERQLMQLARWRSQQPLPAATLCYVWDHQLPAGTELDNPYSRRVRLIVLRGQGTPVAAWLQERRDVHADFLRLFAGEASEVPPIMAIGVAADADNTQGRSLAYVADLVFEP
jgi:Protein of unknown function (DUF3047)